MCKGRGTIYTNLLLIFFYIEKICELLLDTCELFNWSANVERISKKRFVNLEKFFFLFQLLSYYVHVILVD